MARPMYYYGDPARVLEMRGEDCTNCASLGAWRLGGETVIACDNAQAPEKKRARAPESRCHMWRHKQGEMNA